jgi:hypothetical protein
MAMHLTAGREFDAEQPLGAQALELDPAALALVRSVQGHAFRALGDLAVLHKPSLAAWGPAPLAWAPDPKLTLLVANFFHASAPGRRTGGAHASQQQEALAQIEPLEVYLTSHVLPLF